MEPRYIRATPVPPPCYRSVLKASFRVFTLLILLSGVLRSGCSPWRVEAGGALLYTQAGRPFTWDQAQPITFTPDRGPLGVLSNAQAVQIVTEMFKTWAELPDVQLNLVPSGQLPVDVNGENVLQILNNLPRTTNAILFDHDGTIIDAMIGVGASRTVIGFAGPIGSDRRTGRITQARAVLNGRFIDGRPSPGDETIGEYRGNMLHEFGHFLGLDHTSVNREEAFDLLISNNGLVPVMFAFSVPGKTEVPKPDDIAIISALYPSPARSPSGTIRGRVLYPNGVAGFQGLEVIARRTGDPRVTAVGAVSGRSFHGNRMGAGLGLSDLTEAGDYEISGLPAGTYTVEIRAIPASFSGGSGEGPIDPPASLPAPEEFYSGVAESNFDDPRSSTPVILAAGGVAEGIDIVLNGVTPENDDCVNATSIGASPFAATVQTALATIANVDPAHGCGQGRDSNSVWFRFTAPEDGILAIDTANSSYDTVVTVFTGVCGDFMEAACNNNASDLIKTSAVKLAVRSGTTYFIQVSDFDEGPRGGFLRFRSAFTAAAVTSEQEPNNTVSQSETVHPPRIIEGFVDRDEQGEVLIPVGTLTDDLE
ncbi:MAG: hypothetical protein HY650_11435, partial [Acidobacteria bacterium]|nr:hypothetical protein [Acidobacteriota bacterium]